MVIYFTSGTDQETETTTILDHLRERLSSSSASFHATEIPCPTCNHQTTSDGVIASCLSCFLSGCQLCRFEYGVSIPYFLAKVRGGTCTRASSDSAADVLHRAYILLENGFGRYDIVNNNCEDFAIYCKTGLQVDLSRQPRKGLSGQAMDIGARSDVSKVPVEKLIAEMK
ncbi:unnamed protein product [Lupinus luteus]|uniref:LRAT domain-containing protein n=1 Tax=Lupinus luteus TaxID=3873 RepID=A0AAV1WIB7_LUPLU